MGRAKEYLQQLCVVDELISGKLDEADRIMAMLTRTTTSLRQDPIHGSGEQDKTSAGLAKLIDLRAEIDEDIDRYADIKREASGMLAKMKNPVHIKVLHGRYFMGKSFAEIASEIGYSERGVCYIHGRALQEYERVMKAREGEENEKV